MQEQLLIKKSQQGDVNAFSELIKKYEPRMYTFLAQMCNDPDAAQDMAQETFINVFKKIRSYRGEAKFSTWLFQVAANNCLMLKRRDAARPTTSLDAAEGARLYEIADLETNPEKTYDKKQLKQIVNSALQSLPPTYRAVFILSELDGFTGPEISTIQGITLATVKARLRRAREKLKTVLKRSVLKELCPYQQLPGNVHKNIIDCLKTLYR